MASRYRMTIDGLGGYWPQYKWLFWYRDISSMSCRDLLEAEQLINRHCTKYRREWRIQIERESAGSHIEPSTPWPKQ